MTYFLCAYAKWMRLHCLGKTLIEHKNKKKILFFLYVFLDTKEFIFSLRYCCLIQGDVSWSTNLSQTFSHPHHVLIRKGLWPSGLHLQPACVHTVLRQATTFPTWSCIWKGQGFGTMRRNWPLGQSKCVTSGLSEWTTEGCLQWLNTILQEIFSCCFLSASSQDVLHNYAWPCPFLWAEHWFFFL